jgi:transcriptional regulator with XRE-family HTH domain
MAKIPGSYHLTKAFRYFLCEERKTRGLTQFELARKCELTRQSISLIESGRRVPTLSTLFHLSKGFNIPLIKFMSLLMEKVEFYERKEKTLLAADSKKPKWVR